MKKTIAIIISTLTVFWACGGGGGSTTAGDNRTKMVMVGDSFVENWKWGEEFPDYNVLELGVGGETTDEMMKRIQNIIKTVSPCKVFIISGINDICQGKSATQTYESYMQVIHLLTSNGFEVSVVSICYLSDNIDVDNRNNTVSSLNSLLKQYCSWFGVNYIDANATLCPNAYLDERYDSGDGVHLNREGYNILSGLIGKTPNISI